MISAALSVLKTDAQRKIFSDLYKEYKNRFYHIAYSRLKNTYDAEDAIEEAFLRIAERPEAFFKIPDHKKAAYIDVIIRNVSVDMLKKQQKDFCAAPESEMLSEAASIENTVIGNISKDELIAFIQTLSEAQKQVIYLKIEFQMTSRQIAETLEISETAVRKRLSEAGKAIKKFVKEGNENE